MKTNVPTRMKYPR